jgi:recombination protein RecA
MLLSESEREKAIEAALAQLDRQFGRGAVLRLGSNNVVPVTVIPSGSISLDAALGVGGFPRGRVVEVYGPESSGKTTIALHVVAEAHRTGATAAFIDAEHALDPVYARRLGVDVDNLLVSQPDYGEQALEITASLIGSRVVDVVVVDSVAALVPKAELEGEMGDSHMGLQARLMSQALRKLTGLVARTNTCLIFINQIRERIGVMFGNPETTTGGRALKFYASVRMEVRRTAAIKDGEEVIGSRTRIRIVKNKLASPFREVEVDLIHGEGISREADLLDAGLKCELIEKTGAWLAFGGERLGQGRENAKQFLKENLELSRRLEAEIRARLGLRPATAEPVPAKTAEPGAPPPSSARSSVA